MLCIVCLIITYTNIALCWGDRKNYCLSMVCTRTYTYMYTIFASVLCLIENSFAGQSTIISM